MTTHSSILAWRIPQTEDPGGLQSTGSYRVKTQMKRLSMHVTPTRREEKDSQGHE